MLHLTLTCIRKPRGERESYRGKSPSWFRRGPVPASGVEQAGTQRYTAREVLFFLDVLSEMLAPTPARTGSRATRARSPSTVGSRMLPKAKRNFRVRLAGGINDLWRGGGGVCLRLIATTMTPRQGKFSSPAARSQKYT